jgi:hypothetical protein
MARALAVLQSPFALEELQIASPCPAEWNDMKGDDRVRFCGLCEKNVFNLAGMTRREATELVTKTEGSVCVRMYRRADGTVLTSDCPVGVRAALRRARREVLLAAATSVAAVTALIAFLGGSFTKKSCEQLEGVRATIVDEAEQVPVPQQITGAVPAPLPPSTEVMMGDVATITPPPRMGKVASPRPTMGEAVAPTPLTGRTARPQ